MQTHRIARIERVHPRIVLIEVYYGETALVALYLVEGERRALIDTGARDSPEQTIGPALARLGLAWRDVHLIINTHAHNDHAFGNDAAKALSGAHIAMHAADVPLLKPLERFDRQVARQTALDPVPPEAAAQQAARRREAATQPPAAAPPDRLLFEGDVLDLGDGVVLRVVHTPGHSPGCICLYWEAEEVLISGDSLAGSADDTRFPLIFDPVAYRASQESVQRLPVRLVCPGHRYPYAPPHGSVDHPVRQGADARRFLADSLSLVLELESAVAQALAAQPDAPRRVQAAEAIRRLGESWGVVLPQTPATLIPAALWAQVLSAPS